MITANAGVISQNANLAGGPDYSRPAQGRIVGIVRVHTALGDVPTSRRVVLHRLQDSTPLASVVSNPTTGAYEFANVNATIKYFVVALDGTHVHNAVIKSDITPEAI